MDRNDVDRWIAGYERAWASDAAEDIAPLFTDDARYFTAPHRPPWSGRDEIVREWVARGDRDLNWRFGYDIVAIDGHTAVVVGETTYHDNPSGPNTTYANCWIIRFADDGRAREFVEFWMDHADG